MLAVLLLWETHAIVKITKSMGDRLKEEVSLLRLIMWCFSISYAFIAIFYMYELVDGMPCRGLDECSQFSSIMALLILAFLFDFIPNGALYYCHFRATKNSYDQSKLKSHAEHQTSSKMRTTEKERTVMG